MIIYDLDVLGGTLSPDKTDSPAIIDSYAVLRLSIGPQRLEPIAWNGRYVLQTIGVVDHSQLPARNVGDIAEPSGTLPVKQLPGILAAEGADHLHTISRRPLNECRPASAGYGVHSSRRAVRGSMAAARRAGM
jgi:hypothetical protein